MTRPPVAVVVLNWNGLEDSRECLRSLERISSEWAECIVVDNGSSDGSVPALRREFPWARLVETGANLGYAGGNNRGIRAALENGARWVLVLNNDAVALRGLVDRLREAMEADPRLGVVGPRICRRDGSGRFWHAGGRVLREPFRSRWIKEAPPSDDPFPVDYVPGCALFLAADLLTRIGGFDERFFLTWEDTDLCARASAAGRSCAAVPRAAVEHGGSASFGGGYSPLYCYYYFRNMCLYARLHFPRRDRPRAYRDTLGFARAILVRETSPARRRAIRRAILLGLAHFGLGRFGPGPARWLRAIGAGERRPSDPERR